MLRKCDGTDPNLIDEHGEPCGCGLEFDDVEYTVVYPHLVLPSRKQREELMRSIFGENGDLKSPD